MDIEIDIIYRHTYRGACICMNVAFGDGYTYTYEYTYLYIFTYMYIHTYLYLYRYL